MSVTVERPREVGLFEAIQLASLLVASLNMLMPIEGLTYGWSEVVSTVLLEIGLVVGLTLAVTRWRQNWARWVSVLFVAVGTALIVSEIELLLSNYRGWISLGLTVVQGASVFLLFTPQASVWFRTDAAPA